MPEYCDANGRKHWTHVLYVVELDRAACVDRKSKCPREPCDRVPVYVGETTKTPEERFDQHKRGINAGQGWVQHYGLHLRKRLVYPKAEFPNRPDAEKAERALGKRLDARGFCVYGPH